MYNIHYKKELVYILTVIPKIPIASNRTSEGVYVA